MKADTCIMPELNKNNKNLTPAERNHQRALAKIRRLNKKLTQVKLLTLEMDKAVASGKQTVSMKQISLWRNKIKDILNLKDPDE